jgi:hypothetical protein
LSEHFFSDVFVSNVGKFGGKHGELEFGRGLGLTDFCATEINGRRVSEEVEGSKTFCRTIPSNNFLLKDLAFLCRTILSNHFLCVKIKQLFVLYTVFMKKHRYHVTHGEVLALKVNLVIWSFQKKNLGYLDIFCNWTTCRIHKVVAFYGSKTWAYI